MQTNEPQSSFDYSRMGYGNYNTEQLADPTKTNGGFLEHTGITGSYVYNTMDHQASTNSICIFIYTVDVLDKFSPPVTHRFGCFSRNSAHMASVIALECGVAARF